MTPAIRTTRDRKSKRLRQLSIFLPNRLGAMRVALRLLAKHSVRIAGISTLEAADHAVARLIVDRPEEACEILAAAGYGASLSECLGVALPSGPRFGIVQILTSLLQAEAKVWYAYALILHVGGHPILALQVDGLDTAAEILQRKGVPCVGEHDLVWPGMDAA